MNHIESYPESERMGRAQDMLLLPEPRSEPVGDEPECANDDTHYNEYII